MTMHPKEFECLVNSEVFQTKRGQMKVQELFECLVNSEVFQTYGQPGRRR